MVNRCIIIIKKIFVLVDCVNGEEVWFVYMDLDNIRKVFWISFNIVDEKFWWFNIIGKIYGMFNGKCCLNNIVYLC